MNKFHTIGLSLDGLLRVHGYGQTEAEALDVCKRAAESYVMEFPRLGPISAWTFRLVVNEESKGE